MKYTLFLASSSASRKQLLHESKISFQVVAQDADESVVAHVGGLQNIVTQLAELKMKHVIMPQGQEGQIVFVLTADTLNETVYGKILGKPQSKEDAISMLHDFRSGADVGTAFCLQKREYKNGKWMILESVTEYDVSHCIFDVPDDLMEWYVSQVPYLSVAGGVQIEAFGEQFVKEIKGSYSTIVGLPMFKVRQALQKMGFFE